MIELLYDHRLSSVVGIALVVQIDAPGAAIIHFRHTSTNRWTDR
jgi:hypothetical protein